jgi:cell division protein ZapA (FtsZ GTPase activity inhibitor)
MTDLMEEKKQSVKVNIFGEDYPIKGDSETFYIHLKMKEVADRMSNKLPLRVAVLAAMSITDELFKEKEEKDKKLKDVEVKSQSLLDLLDGRLSQEER